MPWLECSEAELGNFALRNSHGTSGVGVQEGGTKGSSGQGPEVLEGETLFSSMMGLGQAGSTEGCPGLGDREVEEHRNEGRLHFSISNSRTEERLRRNKAPRGAPCYWHYGCSSGHYPGQQQPPEPWK